MTSPYNPRIMATHAVIVKRPFPGYPDGATYTTLCGDYSLARARLNAALHTSPPPTSARIFDLLEG